MTIENLKQIAIKYASTKGSRIPLAPDELCNAVVQYFNEFLKITADINTIQVAVTEEGGNIVFTITGNTLDGKAFTPIVITVDHNDFVTNQEFDEFKTSVTKQLNNKRSVISSPASNYVVYTQANGLESNLPYSELANQTSTNIMARRANGTSDVKKGISGENVANMQNIADVETKIPDVSGFATTEQLQEVKNKIPDTSNLATKTELQEVESKIPDITNFADVTKKNTFAEINTFNKRVYFKEIYFDDNDYNTYNTYANNQGIYSEYVADVSENMYNIKELGLYYYCLGTVTNDGMFHEFLFPNEGGTLALTSDIPAIPEYTSVDSVIYDTTNGAIIAYNGANEIHIPLLAGENVTIDASEDNKKIVISAAGGGGTGDVTAAGNNTFTGKNTFNNSIYAKNGVVVGDTTNYGANSVTKGSNTYSFPKKSGTFAMTTDVIRDSIYFISFYANAPRESCHLIGAMMSKNSYGTCQKTNDEFAVVLADNLYTNNSEGLAVYGKLAGRNILCIYSEDGSSIRYLDESNNEGDLPTIMFFITETEL